MASGREQQGREALSLVYILTISNSLQIRNKQKYSSSKFPVPYAHAIYIVTHDAPTGYSNNDNAVKKVVVRIK